MQLYLVLALIFAISVAMFAVQNATQVDINFFIYQFKEISLVIVILGSALFGALIIFLLSLVKQVSWVRKIRTLERQLEGLEKELAGFRKEEDNLPDQKKGEEVSPAGD